MDKAAILAELTANGNITRLQQSPTWEKAFNLYNAAHPGDKKNMRCGHCFRTVKAWLEK